MLMHSATSDATLATAGSEHCMPTGRVHFSVCYCWSCRCHKLFHKFTLLDIFGNCWTTAASASAFFHRPHTCSLVHRHHLQELFTFSVRQLAVRLDLDSQVPSTPFLHERHASVRGFPDKVRISTVCRGDCLPTATAQILCLQECFAPVHDSESLEQVHSITSNSSSFQP